MQKIKNIILKQKCFWTLTAELMSQRFDVVKYKQFEKLTEKQLGSFWRPEEVDILKDAKDFKDPTDFEKHILTSKFKKTNTIR